MNHLDIFTGMGGFIEAASQVWGPDYNLVSSCEIDSGPIRFLNRKFPLIPCHNDVRTIIGNKYGTINLLTGGWPCQDNSKAKQTGGPGKGLAGKRSGLFVHTGEAIGNFLPDFALLENVPEVLTVNNGEDFREVLRIMAEIGYDVEWDCFHASSYGAPHNRERLYLVAYPSSIGPQKILSGVRDVLKKEREAFTWELAGTTILYGGAWKNQSGIPPVVDGVPAKLAQIKMIGNSICPPVVVPIMQSIKEISCQK